MNRLASILAGAALLVASAASAESVKPVSSVDSFRVGDKGVLCTAQSRSEDTRFASMFDRGYDVACRDAATPVGQIYALKVSKDDAAVRFEQGSDKGLRCSAPVVIEMDGLKGVQEISCLAEQSGLNYNKFILSHQGVLYAAEGLSAYESALKLGLASLMADRPVSGEITVASTNAGDPAAFAKVQAASLDPEQALAEGYARNNEGSFAEAAEFFEALTGRARSNESGATKPAEYLANAAIQQSNLGNMAEAVRLFADAAKVADVSDPLFGRLLRNLKAMHRLNGRDSNGALAMLETPVPAVADGAGFVDRLSQGFIDNRLAQRLTADDEAMTTLGGGSTQLTDTERGKLLDAQSQYLRGVALRLKGDKAGAKAALGQGVAEFGSVRGGAVRSMAWMVASASTELAQIAESEGNSGQALSYLRSALDTYQADYPESATVIAARARLASVQVRYGDKAAALATYRELVRKAAQVPGGSEALRSSIKPYFDALVEQGTPEAATDFFAASQAMVRPGVAQTQAVFARELSGGSDEASSLFRQSITLTREIVSTDVEISRLTAIETRSPADEESLAAAQARRKQISAEQTALLARLAAFPKFRVMSNSALELVNLQKDLRPEEGYYKLLLVGETAYGILVRPESAKIMKLPATRGELEKLTNTIRDSIVVEEANQLTTNPFDLAASRTMYLTLFGDAASQMPSIKHLIFEPDGPLLKLPVNVLVTEQAGIDEYAKRQQAKNPDEFDFTGVAWLGRDRMVSTAVSAQAFVDIRRLPPSKAQRRYLGVGQNTPTQKLAYAPQNEEGRDPCDWALSLWNKPISGAELQLASKLLGGVGNEVITEEGYSDTMLRERSDLKDFRIIQFATHGLVTAPQPGCPARPALVTSFGPKASDGLLSFKEIFDLKLDADTIILSACDTAGAATLAATREAGITTGGNFALDGLVRAFVGAGARAVIASHWPVPDDYDATRKLMSVIYEGGTRQAVGESMRLSQHRLMDDPLTSHPYYWAAFAIVGDAGKPITTDGSAAQLAAAEPTTAEPGAAK
jgi:CHAT domain-containing protein/tetratricopeptide (TPR) repeat protein